MKGGGESRGRDGRDRRRGGTREWSQRTDRGKREDGRGPGVVDRESRVYGEGRDGGREERKGEGGRPDCTAEEEGRVGAGFV